MEVQEIINRIMEPDDEGNSKTAVSFGIYAVRPDDMKKESEPNEPFEIEFVSILNPKIKIYGMLDKTMIDLIFENGSDLDLHKIWNIFEKYQSLMHKSTVETEADIPILLTTLIPMEDEGKNYANASNPILWSLTAEGPNCPLSVIRMVYFAEDVRFFTAEDLDIGDVKEELAMDEARRQSIEDKGERCKEYSLQHFNEIEAARSREL